MSLQNRYKIRRTSDIIRTAKEPSNNECRNQPQSFHFSPSFVPSSSLILSYPIFSYLILSYLIPSYLPSSYLISSHPILSYLISFYLILFYLILFCHISSTLIISDHIFYPTTLSLRSSKATPMSSTYLSCLWPTWRFLSSLLTYLTPQNTCTVELLLVCSMSQGVPEENSSCWEEGTTREGVWGCR